MSRARGKEVLFMVIFSIFTTAGLMPGCDLSGIGMDGIIQGVLPGTAGGSNDLVDLIISGPEKLSEGENVNFTLTAVYADGTTKDVTTTATWALTGASGTITSFGLVATPGTVPDETDVTVQATYDENGISKTAKKNILFSYKSYRTITGQILDANKAGVAGVKIVASGDGTGDTTDANGSYQLRVLSGWTGTVVPQLAGYTFDPFSRSYTKVTTNKVKQNFLAKKISISPTPTPTPTPSVDQPPTVNSTTATADLNKAVVITLTGSDPESQDLTFSIVTQPTHGTLGTIDNSQVSSAKVTYTPTTGYSGPDQFTFKANDGKQDSPTATVTITINAAVNHAPTANAQTVSATAGQALPITLTGSDSDGDALTYIVVTQPAHGTLSGTAPSVSYTATASYTGSDSFTFKVNDGKQDSPAATVTITVNAPAVNHAPIANAQTISAMTGQSAGITLTGSDPDGNSLTYAVVTQPANGTLSGTAPNVTYTAAASYSGPESFTFKVNDGNLDSSPATVSITVTSSPITTGWTPPIGIPAPPFGISEANTMYVGKTFNSQPYKDAGNGPYTHYVDNTKSNATDDGNDYGTPDKPRQTIPRDLAAGSVVEVHGGPYNGNGSRIWSGSSDAPIFVRGIGNPRIQNDLEIYNESGVGSGQYVIVEGFKAFKVVIDKPYHHVSVRNNEITGDLNSGGVAVGSYGTMDNHHIVIYNNNIHHNGDWQTNYDQDVAGIGIVARANYIWVLDNIMAYNSSDGIQINGGNTSAMSYFNHFYVGRNTAHHNKQTGLWVKQAADIIFSQNTVYSHRPIGTSPSAWGAGMGFQYGPRNVWFLYNHIYDCEMGFMVGSNNDSSEQGHYFIGNVIHNIHNTYYSSYDKNDPYHLGQAFVIWGYGTKYMINNTIYDTDGGIGYDSTPGCVIVNNIFSNLTSGCHDLLVTRSESYAGTSLKNNLFDGPTSFFWGDTAYNSLSAFQSATGKTTACLTTSPMFVNAAGGDFRLQTGSPAVNSGIVSDVYQTFYNLYGINIAVDFTSKSRPQGSAYDMGAYEQ